MNLVWIWKVGQRHVAVPDNSVTFALVKRLKRLGFQLIADSVKPDRVQQVAKINKCSRPVRRFACVDIYWILNPEECER